MIDYANKDRMLLISDVHYGIKSGGDNTINYVSWMDIMDDYFRSFMIPLVEDVKTEHNPVLVICGDFFDNRISIRVDIMDRAYRIVKELSEHIDIAFLVGNHDSYHSDDAVVNSLKIFSGIENVDIIETNKRISIKGLTIDMFPWSSDRIELGKNIRESDANVVLLHTDINGLSYSSNVSIINGVDIAEFKGTKVYSGHIHKRQETKKVTYIGCPYELDKSDIGNQKGVYSIGVDSDGKYDELFYENFSSPRFITYTYSEFVDVARLTPDEIKNNYITIEYGPDNKTDIARVMNSTETYGCASMYFHFVDNSETFVEMAEDRRGMSITDTIVEYINNLTDITDEQRQFLLDRNSEYIEKVKNEN